MSVARPTCGKELPDEARFCLACGSKVEAAEPPELRKTVTVDSAARSR